MLAELLVEVGDSGETAFENDLVYLVISFPQQVTCLVCTHLVHIVNKTASGASREEAAEGVRAHPGHGSYFPDRYCTVKVIPHK